MAHLENKRKLFKVTSCKTSKKGIYLENKTHLETTTCLKSIKYQHIITSPKKKYTSKKLKLSKCKSLGWFYYRVKSDFLKSHFGGSATTTKAVVRRKYSRKKQNLDIIFNKITYICHILI